MVKAMKMMNTVSEESIDITDIKQNGKFFPATVEKQCKRFHEL